MSSLEEQFDAAISRAENLVSELRLLKAQTLDHTGPSPAQDKIETLGLQGRAYNVLKRMGINTVAQLTATSEREILGQRNIGPKSLQGIKQILAAKGLKLAS